MNIELLSKKLSNILPVLTVKQDKQDYLIMFEDKKMFRMLAPKKDQTVWLMEFLIGGTVLENAKMFSKIFQAIDECKVKDND